MAEGTNLGSAYGEVQIGTDQAKTNLQELGDTLEGIGTGLSVGITAPLLGVGAAAISAGTQLNAGLANVQSLGLAQERVEELKDSVQDLALQTGKGTEDMTGGLYQVVSAFGDSAESMEILETNAKAAAAGLADTTDAINLTSAVTKGYGDTSAEAVLHASDLALKTVELGQTTFPELAGAIGGVIPMANQLSVSQEELFAVMATGSGVTGSTSEVSTQLGAAMEALIAPGTRMQELYDEMGISSGKALVEQEGLQGAMQLVVQAAIDAGEPLGEFIGSSEGQTIALTLAGSSAEVYARNLAGLEDAAGKTESAFLAQTQGINATGFAMQQGRVQMEIFFQKIYDGMGPALNMLITALQPVIAWLQAMADRFANADPSIQLLIMGLAAVAAAIGPVIAAVGFLMPGITALGPAFAVLTGPIGLVVAAVAALAIAWSTNFMGIRDLTMPIIESVVAGFQNLIGQIVSVGTTIANAGGSVMTYIRTIMDVGVYSKESADELAAVPTALQPIAQFAASAANAVNAYYLSVTDAGFGSIEAQEALSLLPDSLEPIALFADQAVFGLQSYFAAVQDAGFGSTEARDEILLLPEALQPIALFADQTVFGLQSYAAAVLDAGFGSVEARDEIQLLPPALQGVATGFDSTMTSLVLFAISVRDGLPAAMSAARDGITTAWAAIEALFGPAIQRIIAAFQPMITGFQALGPQFTAAGAALTPIFDLIGQAVTAFTTDVQGMSTGTSTAITSLQQLFTSLSTIISFILVGALNLLSSSMGALPALFSTVISQVTATFTLLSTTVTSVVGIVRGIMEGDWASVWTNAQALVTGFGTFFTSTFTNLQTQVGLIFGVIGTTITTTLSDLGFDAAAASVQSVIDKITSLTTTIAGIASGALTINFTEPGWVENLRSQLTLPPEWIETLSGVVTSISESPAWVAIFETVTAAVKELPPWVTTITSTVTTLFTDPAWVATVVTTVTTLFTDPSWIAALKTQVENLFKLPSWVTTISDTVSNLFSTPTWITSLRSIVDRLLGWVPTLPDLNPFNNGPAKGSSYMQGGLTPLNERGRELVSIPGLYANLPPGSRVYTNGQSNRMMNGGQQLAPVVVNLEGVVIRTDQDLHRLASRLGNQLRWEQGR